MCLVHDLFSVKQQKSFILDQQKNIQAIAESKHKFEPLCVKVKDNLDTLTADFNRIVNSLPLELISNDDKDRYR